MNEDSSLLVNKAVSAGRNLLTSGPACCVDLEPP